VDSRPPFATGEQRLRLLYRLPLSDGDNRILVVGSGADADSVFDPTVSQAKVDVIAPGNPLVASGFDVVALPGCLTRGGEAHSAPVPPERLLELAFSALRPGGLVVGHLDHLLSVHGLRRMRQGPFAIGTWFRCRGLVSGRKCREALVQAGFAELDCFYVEPRIEAPMALIPVHPQAATRHFLSAIRRTRGQYSALGFGLRMALARARLGGILQPHLLFWARRPC